MNNAKIETIVSRRPINKTAALVVGECRERHLVHKNPNSRETAEKPDTTPKVPRGLKDLTGNTYGRLTVIGYSKEVKKRWAVRCNCGMYGYRRNVVLLRDRKGQDELMCSGCEKILTMRRHDEFKRLGFNVVNKRKIVS